MDSNECCDRLQQVIGFLTLLTGDSSPCSLHLDGGIKKEREKREGERKRTIFPSFVFTVTMHSVFFLHLFIPFLPVFFNFLPLSPLFSPFVLLSSPFTQSLPLIHFSFHPFSFPLFFLFFINFTLQPVFFVHPSSSLFCLYFSVFPSVSLLLYLSCHPWFICSFHPFCSHLFLCPFIFSPSSLSLSLYVSHTKCNVTLSCTFFPSSYPHF